MSLFYIEQVRAKVDQRLDNIEPTKETIEGAFKAVAEYAARSLQMSDEEILVMVKKVLGQ